MTWLRARSGRLAEACSTAAIILSALVLGLSASLVSRWLTLPLAVVAWGLLVTCVLHDLRGPDRSDAPTLGRYSSARLLLTVALGLNYVVARGADLDERRTAVWAAIVVLLVCTAIEPVLHKLQPAPDAAGLVGVDPVPGASLARWVCPIAVALLGIELVVDLTQATPWLWPAIAAVQAVLTGLIGLLTVNAHRDRDRRAAALRRAIEAQGPVFALYTARRNGAYQLRMWMPYLEALGLPYLVVTRDPAAVRPLSAVTSAPVVARRAWRALDDVMVPTLRVAFYVNSMAANSDFVTYRQLRHVYLGHGESDKALSAHPAHAMYDTIVVAGQAAIDRYRRAGVIIPPSKLVTGGRPQVSVIDVANARIGTLAAPTVLYAPTWGGYNQDSSYSSLPVSLAVIRALLQRPAAVIFRPHPLSRERADERSRITQVEALLRLDAVGTGRQHRWGPEVDRLSFAECANLSDAMVTDPSSVLIDYLHSGKPVAVVVVPGAGDDLRVRHPMTRAAYQLDVSNGEGVEATLDAMLHGDPLAPARLNARHYYLGDDVDGGDPAQRFVDVLQALIDQSPVASRGTPTAPEKSR